jgi:predicted metal-dependent phosphotriesterase family hydrolase
MVDCIEELLNQGVTEKEIHEVLIDVPKAILSI